MPRPPFDHFRFIAPLYDRVFETEADPYNLSHFLALPVEGTMLDIGGGTGRVSGLYTDQIDRVVIADVSHGMLVQAKEKPGLQPSLGQVERLPFAAEMFARVLCVDAFHHFFDHPAAAKELWRMVQPGGRLVIVEPDIDRFTVKLIALGETLLLMRSRFFRADALAAFFEDLPGASVDVTIHGYNIIVVVEK